MAESVRGACSQLACARNWSGSGGLAAAARAAFTVGPWILGGATLGAAAVGDERFTMGGCGRAAAGEVLFAAGFAFLRCFGTAWRFTAFPGICMFGAQFSLSATRRSFANVLASAAAMSTSRMSGMNIWAA